MVHDISYDDNINMWQWKMGSLSWLFDFYFFGVFTYGIVKLTKKIKESQNTLLKRNLLYMLITIILGILPPSIFDIIFLNYGVFKFYWIGPITGIFWVIVIGYSMLKYQQMNVRLVFSEVFVVAMVVIFSINIFVDLPYPFFGKVLLPIIFCLVGYFLIRSILNESERREEVINLNHALADLNQNLAQKVEAQTKEIRKAYEVEKRAKEEIERLDQNKSDFIIITQHHLRTPLSQIRWYLDSIASGLYGQISNEVSSAIENTTKITDKLYKILNHFLDISRLKVGHNILNIETVNLKNIIDSAIYEFRSDIKKKMISVKFVSDSWPEVSCDPEKIKDVFMVVLDNSIKYNKEGGEVYIGYAKSKKGYVVNFSNTGVALSKADLVSIFKDSFYRSSEAKKMNPTGMGVSLLVAKTIMLAHKGSIHLGLNKEGRTEVTLEFKR
jgi:signal transduction histidine kinase